MSCAVVTGSSSGIGLAIAEVLAGRGWVVHGVDRSAGGPACLTAHHEVDLADGDAVDALCARLRAALPALDLLVNNAAAQPLGTVVTTAPADWDRTFAVNARAPYLLIRGLHSSLAAAKGTVVNVASVHALATSPGMAAYVASKGALTALTRAAALELAPDGVRVHALLPGAVDTPMLAAGLERADDPAQARENLAASTPLGRIGAASEIADAVLFLAASPASRFMTGQTLVVDGGASVRLGTE